jgi:hypothetical protein
MLTTVMKTTRSLWSMIPIAMHRGPGHSKAPVEHHGIRRLPIQQRRVLTTHQERQQQEIFFNHHQQVTITNRISNSNLHDDKK